MTDAPIPNPEVGGSVAPSVLTTQPAAETPSPSPSVAVSPETPAEIPSLIESLTAPGAVTPEPASPTEAEKAPEAVATEAASPTPEAATEAPKPAVETPQPIADAVQAPVVIDPTTLKLPEGFTAKPEQLGEFATLFNDRSIPEPEKAQKYLDMHTASLKAYAEDVQKQSLERQVSVFNKTRADWRKEVMSDAELGGSGHQTAMAAVARMRDMFVSRAAVGSPQHAAETKQFIDMLRFTGAGDHPAMIRYMHNVARVFDEAAPPPPNPRPPADIGKNPNKPGGIRSIYKSTATNGAAR